MQRRGHSNSENSRSFHVRLIEGTERAAPLVRGVRISSARRSEAQFVLCASFGQDFERKARELFHSLRKEIKSSYCLKAGIAVECNSLSFALVDYKTSVLFCRLY
ncbi:hypothetical protein NPIL_93331 [Nephila pilipes]|uniref:Uncharacterized protein n=1 Tax=Nephila pilipes TaxID=299642 RepID=A0A8X6TQ63_NEPPI|nr:hypothetical protein NPIL_93331 [Nephila pilipes]